eukprot:922084-Pleurochrysis_carterae.AAC.3
MRPGLDPNFPTVPPLRQFPNPHLGDSQNSPTTPASPFRTLWRILVRSRPSSHGGRQGASARTAASKPWRRVAESQPRIAAPGGGWMGCKGGTNACNGQDDALQRFSL